jgi:hypothetical protein
MVRQEDHEPAGAALKDRAGVGIFPMWQGEHFKFEIKKSMK